MTAASTEAIQQMLQDVGLKVKIIERRSADLPARPPGHAGGGRQPLARALVLRLPGRGRRDLPAVPHRAASGRNIPTRPSTQLVDAARGTLDAKQRLGDYAKAFEILRARRARQSGCYQDYAIYGARRGLQWTPTPNEAFFVMDMSWQLTRRVLRHIAGRVVQAIVTIFGVLTLVFFVMHLSGDPTLLLVPQGASAQDIATLRHQLGFDRPLLVQYAAYLADLARCDLGQSLVQRVPVAGHRRRRASPTRSSSPPARCWSPSASACRSGWSMAVRRGGLAGTRAVPRWCWSGRACRPSGPASC